MKNVSTTTNTNKIEVVAIRNETIGKAAGKKQKAVKIEAIIQYFMLIISLAQSS